LKWGSGLPQPSLGCIVVLRRGNSPTSGHVAFLTRATSRYVSLLVGNQGNRVKVSRYKWSNVLSLRWPS
ncbi:TIGR02594 family protein, partial [bacterium]|nr:TIGR02594 family protein [bacterium]